MDESKVAVTLRLPKGMWQRFQAIAEADHRSATSLINKVVADVVAEHDQAVTR